MAQLPLQDQNIEKLRELFNICGGVHLIVDKGLTDLLKNAVKSAEADLETPMIDGRQHIKYAFNAPNKKLIQPTLTVIKEGLSEIAVVTLTLEGDPPRSGK